MACKCKTFEAVNLTLHGHYTYVCTVSKVVGINTENKTSAKQGIHKCSLIKNKYGCQMHSIDAYYCSA